MNVVQLSAVDLSTKLFQLNSIKPEGLQRFSCTIFSLVHNVGTDEYLFPLRYCRADHGGAV